MNTSVERKNYLRGNKMNLREQFKRIGGHILSENSIDRTGKPIKGFKPGDHWSDDFDYIGMLKAGANAPEALPENLDHLNLLYESFQDVNYHSEGGHLGNAIDWLETAEGIEDQEKANDFLMDFREACMKTLKEIERK